MRAFVEAVLRAEGLESWVSGFWGLWLGGIEHQSFGL